MNDSKKELADGYNAAMRFLDVLSITSFLALEVWLVFRVYTARAPGVWASMALILSAYLFADFISGLFHWMGDTWGTPDTPLAGRVFVRSFREHHVDQEAITRHDFLEVNGANSLISLPVLTAAHFLPLGNAWGAATAFFIGVFLFWIFCTNQFHKWAHQKTRPAWVDFLQRHRLILGYEPHQQHHQSPYLHHYCITSGWMNYPLEWTKFFRRAEVVVHAVTGLVPRQDDAAWLGLTAPTPPAREDKEHARSAP